MTNIESILNSLLQQQNALPLGLVFVAGVLAVALIIRRSSIRSVMRPQEGSPGNPGQISGAPNKGVTTAEPCRLTQEQKVLIARAAIASKSNGYTLAIVSNIASPSSGPRANDFTRVLGNLHDWRIIETAMPTSVVSPCGLELCIQNTNDVSPAAGIVADILRSANIKFEMSERKVGDADVAILLS